MGPDEYWFSARVFDRSPLAVQDSDPMNDRLTDRMTPQELYAQRAVTGAAETENLKVVIDRVAVTARQLCLAFEAQNFSPETAIYLCGQVLPNFV